MSYNDIYPVYKMVDTCGGEFDAVTPYYYSCYDEEDESVPSHEKKILVIGSGPIRIGQGIEFDYCCVQGVWAIKDLGYEAIIMNNNPETVSTDFDTSDKLYFESLNIDDVMNVIKRERPYGVILQFGGQTSLNLAEKLNSRSINILGTAYHNIDLAEDREKFCELLESLHIAVPEGLAVTNEDEAFEAVRRLGYPLVVRPSYVIGGRAMQVVYNDTELTRYLKEAVSLSTEHPVLIDQYIQGKEIEVDAIADGDDILIPGIMEHIERAGVHSGRQYFRISGLLPLRGCGSNSRRLYKAHRQGSQCSGSGEHPVRLRRKQDLCHRSKPSCIPYRADPQQGDPRADGKTGRWQCWDTSSPKADMAQGCIERSKEYAVKVPVFSSAKLTDMDIALGPEMKSTGEVLGIDREFDKALYKGFLGAGMNIPTEGNIFVTLKDSEQNQYTADILSDYIDAGFKMYVTDDTMDFFKAHDLPAEEMDYDTAQKWIMNHSTDSEEKLAMVINLPVVANRKETDSFPVRRKAIERGISVMTCMDTAWAFLKAIRLKQADTKLDYKALD